MALAEFAEEVEAWNEVNSEGTSLTDREAEGLADVLDRMEAVGSA